jgi:pseudaminic acid cytidylyltransferase
MNDYFCIIPARGGSKRVPNKNIQEVGGVPLIAHVIQNAVRSKIFKEIYVSTDSERIANISIEFGASVPRLRSPELSDDQTGIRPVMADFILRQALLQNDDSVIACVFPFAILAKEELLCEARARFEDLEDKSKYLIAVQKYPHPIQRAFSLTHDSSLNPFNLEALEARTQDLSSYFHDAGQFYFAKSKAWLSNKSILANAYGFQIPKYASVDVDDVEDLVQLRRLFQTYI